MSNNDETLSFRLDLLEKQLGDIHKTVTQVRDFQLQTRPDKIKGKPNAIRIAE
jgi:hypothetical protein